MSDQSDHDVHTVLEKIEDQREADFYREEDEMPLDEEAEDDH